jgi:hypothetical protein
MTQDLTKFTTQRVLRWRLELEEYGIKSRYKPGPENIIADAFSHVPTTITHTPASKSVDALITQFSYYS